MTDHKFKYRYWHWDYIVTLRYKVGFEERRDSSQHYKWLSKHDDKYALLKYNDNDDMHALLKDNDNDDDYFQMMMFEYVLSSVNEVEKGGDIMDGEVGDDELVSKATTASQEVQDERTDSHHH